MTNKMCVRIAVISHALVQEVFQRRWKLLAKDPGYDVHLLIPEYWESVWFGKDEKVTWRHEEIHEGNFHVHPLPTTNTMNWGTYLFRSLDAHFRKIKPDVIYIIHEESVRVHQQIYLYRRFFAPNAKIIFFSMNARGIPFQNRSHPVKKAVLKLMWDSIRKNTDAALCHYPGCLESLRKGGYGKPVFLQTQVGVDENLFCPDSRIRKEYRKKLGFENKFVIGYVGRLIEDKGVDDLVRVFQDLAKDHNQLALLLIGNGHLRDSINTTMRQHGLDGRVNITGFIEQDEVPCYMNSMDTFVLGSKTMPRWIDTFPLVTVQAQATGVPVIASDSASIPWQLADSARIYPEGNREALKAALLQFLNNEELRREYAKAGRKRSHSYFCHKVMTDNFKKIISQVRSNEYVFHEIGEPYTQWKAY